MNLSIFDCTFRDGMSNSQCTHHTPQTQIVLNICSIASAHSPLDDMCLGCSASQPVNDINSLIRTGLCFQLFVFHVRVLLPVCASSLPVTFFVYADHGRAARPPAGVCPGSLCRALGTPSGLPPSCAAPRTSIGDVSIHQYRFNYQDQTHNCEKAYGTELVATPVASSGLEASGRFMVCNGQRKHAAAGGPPHAPFLCY